MKADGSKVFGTQFFGLNIEDVHAGAYSISDRIATMDELGIWAQVIYPNTFGLGGQTFAKLADPEIRLLTVTIFNDALAEMQDISGGRLVPMAALPWWDLDVAVAEVQRAHALGLRGINTTTAPHQHGLPDLGTEYWNPLWEICCGSRDAGQLPHRRRRVGHRVVRHRRMAHHWAWIRNLRSVQACSISTTPPAWRTWSSPVS